MKLLNIKIIAFICLCFILLAACQSDESGESKEITEPTHITDTVKITDCTGLQKLIDETPSGGTLDLPDHCTYRESATLSKPITLIGGDGVTIKGSDVWSDWLQRTDGLWESKLSVPSFGAANLECDPDQGDRCKWKEQVFVDDNPLVQIAQGTDPSTGQFALDKQRKIVLHDDPKDHKVEVTMRTFWIKGSAQNVTIDQFVFRHAANDRGLGGVDFGGNNWTLKNSSLGFAHAANVSMARVAGSLVQNIDTFGAGQVGIVGNYANGKIEGGRVHDNNIEGTKPSFAGGGIKISNPVNLTITGVEVDHNHDNGIWTDVPTSPQKIVISNNKVHHNPGDGIRVEVTTNAEVFGNLVYENGWERTKAGIALNASSSSNVHDNILAWNYNGIEIRNPLRTDKHKDEGAYDKVSDIHVHHNKIIAEDKPGDDDKLALAWIQAWKGGNIFEPSANNRGNDNEYYFTTKEDGQNRYRWSSPYASLEQFNSSPGEENGHYLTDAEKDQILSSNKLPARPEAH
ncbi:MAG: hypothetical protein K0R75_983 [Paenibacillaceae bacterium]|nr:hypothetical protein [Paenibacillaceae bacterium]